MSIQGLARLPTVIAVLILGAVPIGSAAAPTQTGFAAAEKITPKGVGGVKLGTTYKALRKRGLVATIHMGCNLSGPNARAAGLQAPLEGSVAFTQKTPRRVNNIKISGGATARGVGIGAQLADIQAAYPQSQIDHSTETMFGVTLVKIPKDGGGKLQFALDTKTKKVTLIGIPAIQFCE